ncbi:hypothetical protein XF_1290 [Xylella fastidiosa 9a5c]|uniref:Uncharacterized protein n=1 Tax=Xylella fastidiosa (strain 9a5c) TaxID=160492 RepID=Q9PDT9_XYLFA|nr:hypothetical protein XF_1290 [Xylella fastidiosa 9a5c]
MNVRVIFGIHFRVGWWHVNALDCRCEIQNEMHALSQYLMQCSKSTEPGWWSSVI